MTQTFESKDPATGAVVGVFPVHDADAVAATVKTARAAAEHWRELGFDGRRTRLAAWRGYLARRMNELADLVHRENGKPHADAILEITLAIDHHAWAANHARKVLGPRKVHAGMLAAPRSVAGDDDAAPEPRADDQQRRTDVEQRMRLERWIEGI